MRARGALRRVRPVLALALALPLVAGCGGQSASDGSGSAAGRAADPANPATWVLPLQAYLPDPEQEDLLFDAIEQAKSACMKKYGFDYRPAEPLPDMGPDTLTDLRYGIHDRDVAATYGYKPAGDMRAYQEETRRLMEASALTPEEEAAMTGQKAGSVAGGKLPEGGCGGEAYRRIYGSMKPVSTLANDLSNEAYTKAQQAEPVRKVFRSWADCMADSGYTYDEPMDAPNDPAFGAPTAGPEEVATALADLKCRDRNKVAEVWFDEESRLQEQLAEEHVQELKGAGQVLDKALKAAARTTGSGS
ncbi:hypothetical protein BN159_5494 [Streptomyces davaonensis JCM 4913]|uniref:Secreted protein n=1 Tax=Streptomyces davaonensis (strain DSM 101723 / JCM 4913 / KCC S-0913 / 768) TaxID=1214101 RepID=K4R966_STRDJ|nr:hypothetical protein [Streptomyces davaonensis]CCK29873.1 hypothetical protein BN159_5494 [Streptomyces davaonensis JCM 4913]